MYRINFYTAGVERRIQQARRVRMAAALTLVAGAQVLLLGLFVASALTLRAQADSTARSVASHKQKLAAAGAAENQNVVSQARLLLERRGRRQVWSPVMAALGDLIPDNLIMERVEAAADVGTDRFSGLVFSGRLRSGRNTDPVVTFSNRLSQLPAYRERFDPARVDRLDTAGEVAKFSIVCPLQARGKAGGSSTSEGVGG